MQFALTPFNSWHHKDSAITTTCIFLVKILFLGALKAQFTQITDKILLLYEVVEKKGRHTYLWKHKN